MVSEPVPQNTSIMASSSSSTPFISAPLALPVMEKLTKHNFSSWKEQVMPAIRGAQLEVYLDGFIVALPKEITATVDGKSVKTLNLEYAKWVAHD
jgi:hypothetical protein